MTRINKDMLIGPFVQTLGLEKAEELLVEVAVALGLPVDESYDPAASRRIIEALKSRRGLVGVLATNLETRLVLNGHLDRSH